VAQVDAVLQALVSPGQGDEGLFVEDVALLVDLDEGGAAVLVSANAAARW